jgi:hypothetical protein
VDTYFNIGIKRVLRKKKKIREIFIKERNFNKRDIFIVSHLERKREIFIKWEPKFLKTSLELIFFNKSFKKEAFNDLQKR